MNTSDRSSLFVPVSGLLLVLASLGGLILYEKPFQSQRPHSENSSNLSFFQDEDQPARLWQDPFVPVLGDSVGKAESTEANAGIDGSKSRFEVLKAKIRSRVIDGSIDDQTLLLETDKDKSLEKEDQEESKEEKQAPNLVVIPVMIPGGSYAEASEVRRRTRQAIVSSLAIKGYVPESGQHIGFFKTRWKEPGYLVESTVKKQGNQVNAGTESIKIPYEWFARDPLRPSNKEGKYKAALILWLDEDAFSQYCLLKLNELFFALLPKPVDKNIKILKAEIGDQPSGKDQDKDLTKEIAEDYRKRRKQILDKVDLRFIGPSDSTTLRDLLSRNSWEEFQGLTSYKMEPDEKVVEALGEMLKLRANESLLKQWFGSEFQTMKIQKSGSSDGNPLDDNTKKSLNDVKKHTAVIEGNLIEFVLNRLPPEQKVSRFSAIRSELNSPAFWYEMPRNARLESIEFRKKFEGLLSELLEYDLRRANVRDDLAELIIKSWFDSELIGASKTKASPNILEDRLEIFSYRATAPESLLVEKSEVTESNQQSKRQVISTSSINDFLSDVYKVKFVSTVVPDDQLGLAMVEELQRRGVSLVNGKKHVVLVSEWDTFYGRALPFSTSAIIQYHRVKNDLNWPPEGALKLMLDGSISYPPRVHRFSYMRGIDGAVPGRKQDKNEGKDKSEYQDSLTSPIEQYEQPVGNSGLDYMRRLAVELSKLERELKAKGEQVGAVGVVGSDVYDKLLVLQALRRRFPRAVFFTTDVDARLLHPSQYDWCRNLIIGSSYGLRLQDQLQKHITPFRDNYQSSAFLAGLLALGGMEIDTTDPEIGMSDELRKKYPEKLLLNNESDLSELLQPRIYEVGKNGAYDITPKKYWTPLHPKPISGLPKLRTMFWLVSLVAVVILLVVPVTPAIRNLFSPGSPDDTNHQRNRFALMVFIILLVIFGIGFWVTAYLDSLDGEGEPFELFEGISIWPSEFLRLLMVLLSWVFISNAVSKIKSSDQRLYGELIEGVGFDEETDTPSKNFWRHWHDLRETERTPLDDDSNEASLRVNAFVKVYRWIRFEIRCFRKAQLDISIVEWDRKIESAQGNETNAVKVFKDYQNLGKITNRIYRIIPLVVLYIIFGWVLKQLFVAGTVPYRGELAFSIDRIMLICSVWSLVLLTFFVVDATRLCDVFTKALAEKKSKWKKSSFLKDKAQQDRSLVNFDDMAELIDVRVIAKRTEAIGGLITMPFVVLLVGFFSISGHFDHWRLSVVEYVFFGVLLGYAIICALMLRWSAEKARRKALYRMQSKMSKVSKSRAEDKESRMDQLQIMIREIESLKKGAFSSWTNHPVVKAILIPFGGIGTIVLIDFLSKLGV